MRRRAAISVTAIGLVLLAMLAPFTAISTPAAEKKPLDLAAMALRPSDLADQGYGVWGGQNFTVDEAARLLAASGQGGGDASAIARRLRDAGWIAGQSVTLGLPDANEPSRPSSFVESQLVQFAPAGGAAKGFEVLNDEQGVAGVSQHEPATTIGDRALVTVDRSQAKDATAPHIAADLTFQRGDLVATVGVVTFGASAKPAADSVLIRLAGALMHRIESVEQGKGAPGLSTRALHLSGDALTTYYDNYERIDGTTIPYAGESAQGTAARDKAYNTEKVADSYTVLQTAGDYAEQDYGLYSLYVERFVRQNDAETWLRGITAESVTVSGQKTRATPVMDAPRFGDASTTFAYSYQRPDKTSAAGYVVYLRTGRTIATVQLDGVSKVSLATVSKVASAQATCQKAGDCRKSLASPLTPPRGAATPAATPAPNGATPQAGTPQAGTPVAGAPLPLDANGAWSEPAPIQQPQKGSKPVQELPVIAGRPDGSLVAVWLDFNSGALDDQGNEPLRWAELPAGATTWSKPAPIHAAAYAANEHNIRGLVFAPQLVALPDGSMALLWQQAYANASRLWLSTLPVGGDTWTKPARLPGSNEHATYPSLAAGPGGELYAAWNQTVGGYTRPVFNERVADGTWGRATVVRTLPHHGVKLQNGNTQETGGYGPRVAVAPDGRIVVAWMDTEGVLTSTGLDRYRLIFSVRDAKTKEWGKNLPVQPDDPTNLNGAPLAIAANADGFFIVAENAGGAIAWTMLPAGKGEWTAPAQLTEPALSPRNPRLAVTSTGEMIAAWELGSRTSSVHAAWLAPGGTSWTELPATFKGNTLHEFDLAPAVDGRLAVISSVSTNPGIPAMVSLYTPGGPGVTKVEPTPNPRPDVKEPAAATVYRGNDAHTGIQPGPAPKNPRLLWAWAPKETGLPVAGTAMAPPTLVDGVLYVAVGGGAGRIAAIDVGTGTAKWVYKTDQPVVTAVTVADGLAFAVTKDKTLLALDAETGKVVWTKSPASSFNPPAIVDGTVYISLAGTGQNGVVMALDAKTGKAIWQVTTDAYLQGGPTVVNGVVFLGGQANSGPNGTYPGVLYALDGKTGKVRWHVVLPLLAGESGDIAENAPAVYGGMVYASTKDGLLVAADAKTGKLVWTQRDCRTAVIATQGVVYCGGALFRAFDSLTGAVLWDLEFAGIASNPVMVDGTIYVVSIDTRLYALDTTSRQIETVDGVTVDASRGAVSPLVVDGTIYINNGTARQGAGALLAIGDE